MEIVKWLLITLLPAIALGVAAGVLLGKYRLRQLRGETKPILTTTQRVVYLSSMAIGLACVMFAIFFSPKQDDGFAEGDLDGMGVFDGEEAALDGEMGVDMPVDGVDDGGLDIPAGALYDGDEEPEEPDAAVDQETAEDGSDGDDADSPAFATGGGGGTAGTDEVAIAIPSGDGVAVRIG